LSIVLVAAHDVTQRKKNAGKQKHQHKQTNDVPALQHAIACAASPA
jgi:hypothetical protein